MLYRPTALRGFQLKGNTAYYRAKAFEEVFLGDLLNKRKADSRLVFSTDGGRLCHQCQRKLTHCVCGSDAPTTQSDGIARVRRETKGRGGKAVTVIEGLPVSADRLKDIAKKLKQRCGVGGAVKDGAIEIQGDQRETCRAALEAQGFRCKLAGG